MASVTLGPMFRPCIINGKQKGFCHGIFQFSLNEKEESDDV